jgi:hypothetical protein
MYSQYIRSLCKHYTPLRAKMCLDIARYVIYRVWCKCICNLLFNTVPVYCKLEFLEEELSRWGGGGRDDCDVRIRQQRDNSE